MIGFYRNGRGCVKLKYRIFISLFVLVFIVFSLFVYFIRNDLGKRYMESVEDTLADTANILASYAETGLEGGKINPSNIKIIIDNALKRKLNARIYDIKKTNIGINVYIVDAGGIILYDSENDSNVGRDFSKWNDVYLTLKGQYGARLSKSIYRDTGAIYIAAPIFSDGKVVGALTVVKSKENVDALVQLSKERMILFFIIAFLLYFIISFFLITWINDPLLKLTAYVKSIKSGNRKNLPVLKSVEIKELGLAFEDILSELETKKYIENYIQTLTHEIKSPLSSIRGAAELLEDEMDEDQKKIFYKNISDESKRIENLVSRLLELSSLETRRELRDVTDINLHNLASEITESFLPAIQKNKLNVVNKIDANVSVKGELFLIRHCISNLLDNSIKFSDESGEITLRSESAKDCIKLIVTDKGAGIPDFALNRIFDRFYSIPPKNKKKSTGLGLSFVKEIASLHKGSIEVKNNVDRGVTSILTLPLSR
jgi:two-component system, OmpR family, sensor histidine kinase CreC